MLIWLDEYAVGHEGLDEQHRSLVSNANRLSTLLLRYANAHEVPPEFLGAALEYVALSSHHFAYEEIVMAQSHFSHLTEHRQEHQACSTRLLEEIDALAAGKTSMVGFVEFVQEWVKHHLEEADVTYRQFIAKHTGLPLGHGLNVV